MQGLYKVDGIEVPNIVTNAGRLALLNVVAGKRSGFAESIVVGIGSTPATINDTALDFVVGFAPIKIALVDGINEKIYFKATLAQEDQYTINELGIYPGQYAGLTSQTGALLNNFNDATYWHDVVGVHTIVTDNSKLDATSIGYTIAAGQSAKGYSDTDISLDFLSADTKFRFAYYTQSITSLKLRLKNNDTNYFEYTGWGVNNGYHIGVINKSNFVAVGTPSWDGIIAVEVEAASTPGGSLSLDGLRYDVNLDFNTGMLSRAVLTTPKVKLAGIAQDIEYQLDLDV